MRYLPHTQADIAAMLARVGLDSLDALFEDIPSDCRYPQPPDMAAALTEWELDRHMDGLAAVNAVAPDYRIFLGAGSYDHHIPEVVTQLLRRGELATGYTPYQPEASQGTLQAIYEYQTLITRLLGMDVANASVYDGASALAEALLMALRIAPGESVALSRAIHPHYRQVAATYLRPIGCRVIDLPYTADGRTDFSALTDFSDVAAVAVQSPNFFGCIEDLQTVSDTIHGAGKALLTACFSEPLAFGLYKSPGEQGADIVCGEGQSLGLPRSFGGPGLGLFTARMKYVRQMPGRIVGQTVDARGRRGFVLTLATREQHIRRQKATSNICTNQGLCATAAAMYLACLGGSGLRRLARLNYDKAGYLRAALAAAGIATPFSAPVFNEFVIRLSPDSRSKYAALQKRKVIAGLPLVDYYPELNDHYLVCATETAGKTEMDHLVEALAS
jgi:glycine dehydrogenase subunit 1